MKRKPDFEESSGNVFADLGFKNSKYEMLKARLTVEIYKLLRKRGVTQSEAAKLLGTTLAMTVPKMSQTHPNSYSAGSNLEVIFQYSTSRHGVIANTRPWRLRYQLVMPLWVHTMRACRASISRLWLS